MAHLHSLTKYPKDAKNANIQVMQATPGSGGKK